MNDRYVIALLAVIAMVAMSGCLGGDDDGSESDDDKSNDLDDFGGDFGAKFDYGITMVAITPDQKTWEKYTAEGKYYKDDNETAHLVKGVEYWIQAGSTVSDDVGSEAFKIFFYIDDNYVGNCTQDFDNEDNSTNFYWTVDVEPGSHILKAVVDPYKAVKDKDRSNNKETLEFIVDAPK